MPPHPLLVELRDGSLKILEELARRMLDSADDALFEMGEKAANDGERRRYFDTMRVLRIDRGRITREFLQQLAAGFGPGPARSPAAGAFDLDSLAIQPTDELEEKIALSNMATKAEGICKNQIWELERRLEIAVSLGVPLSPQALSPARICDAFGSATAVLETEFQVKLVVYKLFDRVLARELERVYKFALDLLDREGIDSRRAAAAAVPRSSGANAYPPLRDEAFDPARLRGTGNPQALELAETLQGLLRRGGVDSFQASSQRLSMASHLFDELLGEPLLPDSLRPALETLRYPMYRTALSDPSFFTSVAHPARRLLGELVEFAAATQTGEVSTARFRNFLQAAVAGIESAAAGAQAGGAALSAGELEGFLQQVREQARTRRASLLLHVRRQVAQELELRTLGREVPKPVLALLRSGIGPLLAVRMLKSGRASPQFRAAESLLERVLGSLEFIPPVPEAQLRTREQLLDEVVTAFKDIGMAEDRIESLLNGLQEVYGALDQPVASAGKTVLTAQEQAQLLSDFTPEIAADIAPQIAADKAPAAAAGSDDALPKVTALELLRRVLAPESWFRVFDAAQNQTRWLKLASFYANQDSVTFTGFDETTRLSLRATRLAEDLVQGYSEPINPSPTAREALEQLRQAKARGLL